jgi:putative transposase
MWEVRKTARLGFGRFSKPGANYFITFCTKNRDPILTTPAVAETIASAFSTLHPRDITLFAATIMPDHVHLIFELGQRLQLGQVVGKFKTLARDSGRAIWRWQKDGFEHQVRNAESIEDYAFYIFMNPYRAGLCSLNNQWPGWICPNPGIFQFLDSRAPTQQVPAAWLELSDHLASRIAVGD